MNTRKLVASATAVLTLGVGGLAVAAVNPFASAGAATPTTSTATSTPATPARHGRHNRVRVYLRNHRGAIVTISAKSIGIPKAELVTDLRSGESIAQVAAAHHVPTSTVTSALDKAAATAAVAKAEAAGKLTSAQAAKIDARLPKAIDRLVDAHKK